MSFWKEGGLTQLAQDGELAGVERLLDAGVPVDYIENGRFSDTPLQVAARGGHLEVVQLLLRKGAHVNHVDNDCFSPVTAAAGAHQWKVVKCLVEHGGNFAVPDATGKCGHDYLKRCRSKRLLSEIKTILHEPHPP